VIKPAAGEIFKTREQIFIEWLSTGIRGNVAITLKRTDGSAEYTIASAVSYDESSYSYNIHAGISSGAYAVEIRQGAIYGLSGIFTIN
jgi:hypothetical protein